MTVAGGEGLEGRIGLVLGAGGLVGHAWHAGVLAGLAEGVGWDPRTADVVVGTSAGSVVGSILRAGLSADDVFARATGGEVSAEGARLVTRAFGGTGPVTPPAFTRPSRFSPAAPRTVLRALNPLNPRLGLLTGALPRGTTDTSMISDGIGRLHADGWPSQPLWVCAVRLRDGRRVVFGRDRTDAPVGTAVAASCAIPGFYAPVAIDGIDHVDGGVHSPTNGDVLVASRLRLAVISSPMSMDRAATRGFRPDRALRLGHRATLTREVAALRRAGTTVVSLQPGPADIAAMGPPGTAMDPDRRAPVARQARETTLRRLADPAVSEALAPLSA